MSPSQVFGPNRRLLIALMAGSLCGLAVFFYIFAATNFLYCPAQGSLPDYCRSHKGVTQAAWIIAAVPLLLFLIAKFGTNLVKGRPRIELTEEGCVFVWTWSRVSFAWGDIAGVGPDGVRLKDWRTISYPGFLADKGLVAISILEARTARMSG